MAFFAYDGTIINIEELPPNYVVRVCSQYAQGALFMRSGWFAANGIQPGDTITPFKPVTVRELPDVLARYEHEPSTAPVVAWADWNGLPLARLNAESQWIGETETKVSRLLVTVPTKTQFTPHEASLIDPTNPHAQMRAMENAAVNQVRALFKEKLQTLQPWEGVLSPENQGLLASVIDRERLQIPLSVAILDASLMILYIVDWNPGEATDQLTVVPYTRAQLNDLQAKFNDLPIGTYALITHQGWFEAYGFKRGLTLPLIPMSEEDAAQALAKAQAQERHTIAMLAKAKVKQQQEAQFRAIAQDVNRLREYYDIDVKLAYHNPKISGSHQVPTSILEDIMNGLTSIMSFGLMGGGSDEPPGARAWQCSDRSYTVTLRPKRDIEYVDAVNNPNPVTLDATWSLSHVVGGDASTAGSTSRKFALPLRRAEQASETFTFDCVNDLHTEQGEETSSELSMALSDQSAFGIHHTTSPGPVNHDAVYAESSRQWDLLNQAIAKHNASFSSSSYDSSSSSHGPSKEKCQGIVNRMQGETRQTSSTRYGVTTGTIQPKYTSAEIMDALKREGCM